MNRDYSPKPADTSAISLPHELMDLTEAIARGVHDTWAAGRFREGWSLGPRRDDTLKTHPSLVPYEDLPESEKEYDRATVATTLRMVVAEGFEIKKTDR